MEDMGNYGYTLFRTQPFLFKRCLNSRNADENLICTEVE